MKTYISQITVEWIHCDIAGIVFYPHFYTWFDQGTERLFKANGLSYPELRETYQLAGLPLVETGSGYRKPCHHQDELEMHSWVAEWAKKTLLVKHRVLHSDGSEALEGFERRVWALSVPDSETGMRAAPIPDEVRRRFAD